MANKEDLFVYKFKNPVMYNGKSYSELSFDFDAPRGRDCLAIENELRSLGISAFSPIISTEYQVRYAAKSCSEAIGADFFEELGGHDFIQITGAVRSFLIRSE